MALSNACIPSLDMPERVWSIQAATGWLRNIEARAHTNKIALLKLAGVSAFIYGAPIVFFVTVTPPLTVIVIASLVGVVALAFILKIAIKKYKPIRQFNRYNHRIENSIRYLNNSKEELLSAQFKKCIEKINDILSTYNSHANNSIISDVNSVNSYIYECNRNLTNLKKGDHVALLEDLLPFEKDPSEALPMCFEIVERTSSKTVVDYLTEQLVSHGFFIDNEDKIPHLFYTTLIEKGERAAEHLAPIISEIHMSCDNKINIFKKVVEKCEGSDNRLPENIIFPDFTNYTADERLNYYKKLLRCPNSAKFMAENPSHLKLANSDPKERIQFYKFLCNFGLLPEKFNQLDWTEIPPDDRLRLYTDIVKVGRLCHERAVELAHHIHEIDLTGITTVQLFKLFEEIVRRGDHYAAGGLLAHLTKLKLIDVSVDQIVNLYEQIINTTQYFYTKIEGENIFFTAYHSLRQALNSRDLQDKFDLVMIGKTIDDGKYLDYLKTLNFGSAKWLEIARKFCKSKMQRSSELNAKQWDDFANNCSYLSKSTNLSHFKHFLEKELLFLIPYLNSRDLLNLFDDSPHGLTMFLAIKDKLFSMECIPDSLKVQLCIQSYRPALVNYPEKSVGYPTFPVGYAPILKILKSNPNDIDFCLALEDITILRTFILQNKKISFLDPIITRKKEETEKLNEDKNKNFDFSLFMHWICYVAANLYLLPEEYVQRFHSIKEHDSQEITFQKMSQGISLESSITIAFNNQRYAPINKYVSDVWGMSNSQ